jgi:vitellogenic carboxypeptidase-like protein
MTCVADDFYYALKELLLTPAGCLNQLKFKPDHPFFVFGESYGGKYAPAIGEKILREAQDNNATITGLKGVAIGDGFTNPSAILSQMGEYAYNLGLLDYQERSVIEQVILNGTFQERRKYWKDLHNTFEVALDLIVEWAGGVNVYDITKYREYPDLIINEYLGNDEVQTLFALRKDIKFGGQGGNVYEAMYEDFMMPYFHLVEEVLRRNCKVMVYNGQNDLIV